MIIAIVILATFDDNGIAMVKCVHIATANTCQVMYIPQVTCLLFLSEIHKASFSNGLKKFTFLKKE